MQKKKVFDSISFDRMPAHEKLGSPLYNKVLHRFRMKKLYYCTSKFGSFQDLKSGGQQGDQSAGLLRIKLRKKLTNSNSTSGSQETRRLHQESSE